MHIPDNTHIIISHITDEQHRQEKALFYLTVSWFANVMFFAFVALQFRHHFYIYSILAAITVVCACGAVHLLKNIRNAPLLVAQGFMPSATILTAQVLAGQSQSTHFLTGRLDFLETTLAYKDCRTQREAIRHSLICMADILEGLQPYDIGFEPNTFKLITKDLEKGIDWLYVHHKHLKAEQPEDGPILLKPSARNHKNLH